MEINISWSNKLSHNYIPEKVSWKSLYKLTSSGYNYCAGRFHNGHRTITNWRGGNNCVILDIDENLKLSEATQILLERNLKGLLITTKSHQKIKNGVVCDRFRVILPMKTALYTTAGNYRKLFIEICRIFDNKVDVSTKDPSRFFYGNPEQQHWYIDGSIIADWKWFKVEELKKENKKIVMLQSEKPLIEWGLRNIKNGNRNTALYWIYMRCVENGFNERAVVTHINSMLEDPLPKNEIDKLLRID